MRGQCDFVKVLPNAVDGTLLCRITFEIKDEKEELLGRITFEVKDEREDLLGRITFEIKYEREELLLK